MVSQLPGLGFPIRKSPDNRLLASTRGLSQLATSFIAYLRQGIHTHALSSLTIKLTLRTRLRSSAQGLIPSSPSQVFLSYPCFFQTALLSLAAQLTHRQRCCHILVMSPRLSARR